MIEKLKQIYMQGFSEDGEKYADYFCNKNAKNAVYYPEENPVSAGYIIDKKLSNGQSCAYFSALATKIGERGKGYASALISKSLIYASKKYSFAVLSPFNSVFYLKYGFFTTQFAQKVKICGNVALEEKVATQADLEGINTLFSNGIAPLIDRDYLLELIGETAIYNACPIVVKDNEKIVGFCVRERNSLSRVLSKNLDFSTLSNFNGLTYKKPAKAGDAFIQLRILSLTKFLKDLKPKRDFAITISVEDEVIEENNGCFKLKSSNNKISLTKQSESIRTKVKIGDLVRYLEDNDFIEKFETQFIDEY